MAFAMKRDEALLGFNYLINLDNLGVEEASSRTLLLYSR